MGKTNREIIKEVRDFKEKAARKYGIQRVILFGSQARGEARADSDIDLLVVSDRFRSRADFMSRLSAEWHLSQKRRMPVDFICFNNKEFASMSRRPTIVKQALAEGITI